jgi:hypothetical protein
MAAVFVMALAISTSITTLQVGYRSVDTARNTTIASQVLQSMIEDIRLLTWSGSGTNVSTLGNLTDQPLSAFDIDQTNHYQSKSITDFSSTASAMLARFTFSRAVTDVSGTTVSGASTMKVIVLTAKWTGIDGKQHTLKYTTYYGQNGLYAYYST